jgi:peptidoglycan hydrolase-like protein with peptidoglycan-binding domain
VRDHTLRADDVAFDDDDADERPPSRVRTVLHRLLRRPVDSAAGLVAGGGVFAILVNALFLQSGPHPAPIFANKPATVSHSLTEADTALPRAPSGVVVTMPLPAAPPRPRARIVADIQRELTRRGYYQGNPDGVYGPKTDAAIREFEQAAGLRPSQEPSDALLAEIARAPAKLKSEAGQKRPDPIAGLLAADPGITAVQRALSSYGYGQIQPTGVYDPETRAAIERFERERRMPVTGRVSERLTRELTALTGRPLE